MAEWSIVQPSLHNCVGIFLWTVPHFSSLLIAGWTGPRLTTSRNRPLVLEIKGHEDEQDRAKHQAAKRWMAAVNNWGQLGRCVFHVCKDPQVLGKELDFLKNQGMKFQI